MSAPGPRAGNSARNGKSSKLPVTVLAASRASPPGMEPTPVAAPNLNWLLSLTQAEYVTLRGGSHRRDPSPPRPDRHVGDLRVRGQVQGRQDGGRHRLGVDPPGGVVLLALLLVDLGLHGAGRTARVDRGDADAVAVLLLAQGVGQGLEAVLG